MHLLFESKGFISVRKKMISVDAIPHMGRYVLYLALPSVIIKTIINIELDDILEPQFFLAYILASSTVLICSYTTLRKIMNIGEMNCSVMATGMVVPNSVFIGYPILIQYIDNPPVNAFAMALLVENLIILPICFMLMDYHSMPSKVSFLSQVKVMVKRASTNPLLLSISIGVLSNIIGIHYPTPMMITLSLLGSSSAAVALFVIGGSLANIVAGDTNKSQVLITSFSKLLLHPLVAGIVLYWIFPVQADLAIALIIITSVPMMSFYTIIGDIYGKTAFCATTQLCTTVLSIFTIPLVIYCATLVWYS